LPQNFFSPLSSSKREHYAALLLIYFELFQESPHGIERPVLMARFNNYFSTHQGNFVDEEELADEQDLDWCSSDMFESEEEQEGAVQSGFAARYLRELLKTGWMSEEVLPDYTQIINITVHARPFLEALAKVEGGMNVEYESHVVSIYSLLCGDAAKENGHYMVINAHAQTLALIDSLKVLSQTIREHYERLTDQEENKDIADILALHYTSYANDILDAAYKRLKTSDNLSRYRPKILSQVRDFLLDQKWLRSNAKKYAQMAIVPQKIAEEKLSNMLEEIRDIIKAVDPLLDEIDRRNMLYAKSSVERVRALLEPASTISGKIMRAAQLIMGDKKSGGDLAHHLYRVEALAPESRYRRWLKQNLRLEDYEEEADLDVEELKRLEVEFRLSVERQLSPDKIAAWLDEKGGLEGPLYSQDLAQNTEGFIRLVYALLFADSERGTFPYFVEKQDSSGRRGESEDEAEMEKDYALIRTNSNWQVPSLYLRRQV